MKLTIEMPFSEEELKSARALAEKGKPEQLRLLCRKEAERFEALMKSHPQYQDGLIKIERLAVEGYLYQKLRGHLDAKEKTSSPYQEGQNGTT